MNQGFRNKPNFQYKTSNPVTTQNNQVNSREQPVRRMSPAYPTNMTKQSTTYMTKPPRANSPKEKKPFVKNHFQMMTDYGPKPFAFNITEATLQNDTFRTALWTGDYLQLTLMSIEPGDQIGLEIHENLDQFIRIEQGQALVMMGDSMENLPLKQMVYDDFALLIPAGTWHNIINNGKKPLKLYSIYAPPQHPYGTVHKTRADAEAAEE